MSESQAALLFGEPSRQAAPRKPRTQRRRELLPENILESQIKGFLESRGWLLIRQQVGTFVPYRMLAGKEQINVRAVHPVRIGEKGAADWIAVRPAGRGRAEFFFFECKAGGKKPKPEQREWLEKRAAVGLLAAWFDDFSSDWDTSFLPWYRARFGE